MAPLVIDRLLGKDFAIVVNSDRADIQPRLDARLDHDRVGARRSPRPATGCSSRSSQRCIPLARRRRSPWWFQFGLSSLAVIFLKTFENLAGAFVFTMWIFYAMAGASTSSCAAVCPTRRAYRCWGYPVVPALFIASALVMTVLSIMESREKTLPWIAVLLAGIPVYYLWQRATPHRPGAIIAEPHLPLDYPAARRVQRRREFSRRYRRSASVTRRTGLALTP